MRYLALATDYDGTIAHHGSVDDATIAALERCRTSGRKLILVTGRELGELTRVFPRIDLFDRVVAENGALLYEPATRSEQPIGEPPPAEFVRELEKRGVAPISVGRVIVATWQPYDTIVHDVIRDLALELQVIFNKGAVMVLPSGLNKAVGLQRALDSLKLSLHNTVGVGDAENDHAFLSACECGVAVANALDSVKSRVDWVTQLDHGAGVIQLIDDMIESDLAELNQRLTRHDLPLGETDDAAAVALPAYNGVMLVAGPSGAGKTTVTTALVD
ncbi:MAG: HAD-IIB family hydrolase, partial [Gemmatimonadota bacterium]